MATSFFIDCANNVIEFVEVIYNILKPGGIWVNLGPLLYHFSDVPSENSIEPTYEDLIIIIRSVGFTILVSILKQFLVAVVLTRLIPFSEKQNRRCDQIRTEPYLYAPKRVQKHISSLSKARRRRLDWRYNKKTTQCDINLSCCVAFYLKLEFKNCTNIEGILSIVIVAVVCIFMYVRNCRR